MSARQTTNQRGISPLLLLFLAAIVVSGPLLAVMSTPQGSVLTRKHAVERHGSEAVAIRDCLQKSGPAEEWVKRDDPNVEYWMCQIPSGKWCIMVAQVWNSVVDGAEWRESTSFCPRDGSYQKVVRYLSRFATRTK